MIDWQPIETAPKDETMVLLRWAPSGYDDSGDDSGDIVASGYWIADEGGWFAPLEWEFVTGDPTHWAPLNLPGEA